MIIFLLVLACICVLLTLITTVAADDLLGTIGVRTYGLIAVACILAATAITITEILA